MADIGGTGAGDGEVEPLAEEAEGVAAEEDIVILIYRDCVLVEEMD
jgi:hypothetical protein